MAKSLWMWYYVRTKNIKFLLNRVVLLDSIADGIADSLAA